MINVYSKTKPKQYSVLTCEILNMGILFYTTITLCAVIKAPLLTFGIYFVLNMVPTSVLNYFMVALII